jgi:hypothetical protein
MPRRRDRMLALGGLLPAAGVLYGVVARPRINQWGATDQEHQATWPGDRLLAQPGYVWTNAITIQQPAEQVWPWLAQLGQGRGGLYSYDWLENLVGCDIHSADRILPQYQQPLRVGDRVIRMARYAPANPVALFEPGRALVLGGVNDSDARPCRRAAHQHLGVHRPPSRPAHHPAAGPVAWQLADESHPGPDPVRDAAQGDGGDQPARRGYLVGVTGRCGRTAAVVAAGGGAGYGVGQGAGPARAMVAAIPGGGGRHGRAARVAVLATADRPGCRGERRAPWGAGWQPSATAAGCGRKEAEMSRCWLREEGGGDEPSIRVLLPHGR